MLDLINADIIANEVAMLRNSMNGPIALVEGETDIRVYKRFFMPAPHVRMIYCKGKPVLREVMRKLGDRRVSQGVLGICDADYDRILGRRSGDGVFFADLHDAETMIAHSSSFHRVFDELFNRESSQREFQEVRDSLFAIAARIGAIRLWNERNSTSLKFNGVNPGGHLKSDGAFDVAGFVADLLDNSVSSNISHSDLIEVYGEGSQEKDAEMASGHDFCALLAAQVCHARSSDGYEVAAEVVEAMLRLSFDDSSFSMTDLSRNLGRWEQESGVELLN
ncbi:DUF4435 domain-containing protein [Streptomyces roseolus]|uniref:DUF4435 domain-containing protein n=1 Tax=Streptomyces roseolus TaxID=67358 RepID=UPI00378AF39C